MKVLIYGLLLVATMGGMKKCDHDGEHGDADRMVMLNEIFEVKLNEAIAVKKEKFGLTLSKAEDSRCPVDVNCIRAGEVFATFQILGEGGKQELKMELVENCNPKQDDATCGVSQTVMGYNIQLMSILPYPGSEEAKQKEPVTAKLRITKN